ncbi:MAG: OprD family outer membrane porin [Actinomycetota bacterium]
MVIYLINRGYLANFLQLNATLYTSQPLYAPADAGDTLNLTTYGDQITTLGQANVRVKAFGQELTVGRELVRTPYINPEDDRMIPNTFQGIVLLPAAGNDPHLDYVAAYLQRYKPRNDIDFVPITQPLGVSEDEGVLINGVHYRAANFNVGFVNYWIKDAMNTAYGEVDYTLPFGDASRDGPALRISLNDIDQRSVGAELMPGSPFATYQASARLIASYRGFVLTGAVSQVGRGAQIQKPYGWSPAYTAMMISSFQRAGELGGLVELSYDFSRVGLNGLGFYAALGRGINAITPGDGTLPDRNEIDLRLEYEPHGGRLEGLRVQLDYIDEQLIDNPTPSDDLTQFRAVVNYLVPLF